MRVTIIPANRTIAAPLAGVSDSVFRRWAVRFGAGLVFTEMTSAEGVRRNDRHTLDLLRYTESERPIVAQIFDDTAEALTEAAVMVENLGFDGVDINLGCPAKKVVKKGAGSALMKDVPKAIGIIRKVVDTVRIPVSVKMRAGWKSGDDTFMELVPELERLGVAFATLHPRSRDQFFTGIVDRERIRTAVGIAGIPIVGNGDVHSGEDAAEMIEQTGCAAVMIGRASMGNPWIFRDISSVLCGKPIPEKPATEEIIGVCSEYISDLVEFYGERNGVKIARKHVAWFTSGMPGSKPLRTTVFSVVKLSEIERALQGFIKC